MNLGRKKFQSNNLLWIDVEKMTSRAINGSVSFF